MFVRFRQQSSNRLSVSIVESHRIGGKLKHEHIAALGSIETPPTIADRVVFWKGVHERLARLSNRIGAATQGRLMGALHARIPMVTPDEQRALQRGNIEADEKFWTDLHDMHAGTVDDHKESAAIVGRKIAEGQAEMAKAAEKRDAARARRERLDRGENVDGWLLDQPLTRKNAIKILGSESDLRHMELVHELYEAGAEQEYLDEMKRRQPSSKAAARAVLRRRQEPGF